MEETNKIIKKNKITLIVGIVLFLILVLSASYAYFQITSVNNGTTTTVTGTGEELGTPTLTTNTTSLKLNLTADLMGIRDNMNKRLYATPSGEAVIEYGYYPYNPGSTTPVAMENGRYKLATASVTTSDLSYNCSYSFDVSATVAKPVKTFVSNDSDDVGSIDVHVIVTSPKGETYRYRLDELLSGTKTISGTITNLTKEKNQEFTIESYVYNDNMYSQNDLADNTYTVSVTPKSGTSGFKCEVATEPVTTGFAKNLIDSNKMKQTGLEGDGYRFQGTGTDEYCFYDNGNYISIKSSGTCPTLYHYTRTTISTGATFNAKYQTRCPSDDAVCTYSCTTLTPTTGNSPVDNYVCFGTTNKSDCTSNPDKYMYRVLGVFPDEYGNQHVKLLKISSIGQYAWHSQNAEIDWHDSDLSKGLNGSYFYTNTTYDYMQNSTWRNKISNWRWTEATSSVFFRNSLSINATSPMSYTNNNNELQEIYLHEMNRKSKKYTLGNWTYSTSKIGLMYVSDYIFTLPNFKDKITGSIFNDYLPTSWMYPTESEYYMPYTMTRSIYIPNYNAYFFGIESTNGYLLTSPITEKADVYPTFYLESNVELGSGTGTSTDPYILK